MKKNYLLYSFISITLVITIVSLVSNDKEFSELENRNLKTNVTFSFKDFLNGSFQESYEKYINDQFPIRDKWISLKSISEYALGKIENNGIIYGENGKLFEKFDLLNEERLINNIDCSDRNKFMFICNKYMDSEVNYLIKNPATNAITIPTKSIIISPELFSPLPSLLDLAFNVSFIDTTIVGISFKAPIIPPQSIIPAPIYLT